MSKELVPARDNVPAAVNQKRDDGTLIMENCRILFRNFAGAEGMYNREGDRNFCVLLDNDTAAAMREDGWNIKQLRPREEGDEPQPYIQVAVGFKGRPPRMVMITSRGRIELGEDECELLDWADILICDLIIRPYHWNVNGKTGVKAYLKSIFITINEDYLELKYADVPMAELESPSSEANTQAVQVLDSALKAAGAVNQDPNPDEGDDIVDAEWSEN